MCARSRRPGYSALWIPEGGGSNDVLTNLSWLLGASERLTIASGIANISAREPEVLARGAAFLRETSGNRLVLGIGVGHSYSTVRRGIEWDEPLDTDARLSGRDGRGGRGHGRRRRGCSAALGDGMLRLAAERALGAHSLLRAGRAHGAGPRGARDRAGAGRRAGRAARPTMPAVARASARAWAVALPGAAELRQQLAAARLRRGRRRAAAARIGCWMRRSRGDPRRSSIGCARTWRRAPTTSASRSIGSADPDEDVAALRALAPALLSG